MQLTIHNIDKEETCRIAYVHKKTAAQQRTKEVIHLSS
ncbi:hypothetical protein QY96_00826 [Bacillus thermotolerans]|uniref:Uncharacterized protein n=1 Tax=Bacillus thermotolerans TaxID=1221996 RepID=A0A0F5ICF2_BACTR|nr:hypothetical protein QY95_02172 [Bacillus thermotolerans]KKB43589.1 hypothetical protein QY96_00826 [Bacillus thermotolerans]